MKTDLILKFKQNLFSKVIWSSTFINRPFCQGGRIFHHWLMDDIELQIDDGQFGNRKGSSTTHYLVKLVDEVLKHNDLPKSLSRIIITDFGKAFDRGDHIIAIPKLLDMGTRPALLPWICVFLTDTI